MAFNRSRGGSGGRDFNRSRFSDRGSRGPVEMHKAICDQCHKDCEVPFRPTSGKPIFCSNCFESKGAEPRRFSAKGGPASGWEGRNNDRFSNFEDRPMFDATCDDCGNACKVPFQPRGDKPIYCSNCFGDKKGAGSNGGRVSGQSQPQSNQQLEALNSKLDRILQLLDPQVVAEVIKEAVVVVEEPSGAVVADTDLIGAEIKSKPAKKKSTKKVQ